jgi:hypothetical protein
MDWGHDVELREDATCNGGMWAPAKARGSLVGGCHGPWQLRINQSRDLEGEETAGRWAQGSGYARRSSFKPAPLRRTARPAADGGRYKKQ